jgi:nucleoid-associated protein YgaU
MKNKKLKRLMRRYFKSTEEVVSMFLGLVIVVVVVGLIFNFFQKRKGIVDIPGSSDIEITQDDINGDIVDGEYIVTKGDSLWKIAEEQYNDGYKWVEIAKANNINNPGMIEIGDKLVLPKLEVKFISVDEGRDVFIGSEYAVVKGDSLWEIAVTAYGDGYQWPKIWQANQSKLVNPSGLEIGMMLNIPILE